MKRKFFYLAVFAVLSLTHDKIQTQATVDETTCINKTLYVDPNHPNTSDGNTGTDSNYPLSTINAAVSPMTSGTKIIIAPACAEKVDIHAGQGKLDMIKDPNKEGFVSIRGSDVFENWQSEGNGKYSHHWPFNRGADLPPVNIDDNVFPDDDDDTELEKRREIVFIDGDRYELVLNESKLTPGKFVVDEANDKMDCIP